MTIGQVKKFCVKYLEDTEGEKEGGGVLERVAGRLGMSVRGVKLMYEVVEMVFGLEGMGKRLAKTKNRVGMMAGFVRRIKEVIGAAMRTKVGSGYLPRSQIRLSLRELH